MGLHYVLQHLDRPGTYVRILFVDFSSAFNTIIPDTLQNKLTQLSVPTFICQWINSFLIDRQQLVRLGQFSSSTRTISTGAPQGCVLSSLLFSLYINDSTSKDSSVKLMKSSRTVTSLLTDRKLRSWLSGAVLTTWSLTRSKQWRWLWTLGETPLFSPHSPSWTALWLQWSHSDSWAPQFLRTCTAKKIEKGPAEAYFLRQLRKFHLPQELLIQLYTAIIESILCTSILVWFSSATKSDLRRLRRVVRTAERIIGTTLPTLQELYSSRVSKRAGKITLDPHIQHTPSLNCYRLVDATELWAPERPDTETVSFLRQSISWTLDIKRGTHNTIIQLFIHHTHLFFSFQICTCQTSHNCRYCIGLLCFCHILYIVLLLSVSCPVAVTLSHCGAPVTITNSSYV